MTSLELCAGAGGQAVGLESAGFDHVGLVELDAPACSTLLFNRPQWRVFRENLNYFDGRPFRGVDLIAGGLPCPPFSRAGKQLGEEDERNLFPAALRILDEARPHAVMIENVRGILDPVFSDYRSYILDQLTKLGYHSTWQIVHSSAYGVPQLRPRAILVALRTGLAGFSWPEPKQSKALSVGETLLDLMQSNGWEGARSWAQAANDIAPTIVGGSKKHGGPDLGPTRAKRAWAKLGVDGHGIANEAPVFGFEGMPRLTLRMVARLQGFSDNWTFVGAKTHAYRQIGNAFPPPVAKEIGSSIAAALNSSAKLMVAI